MLTSVRTAIATRPSATNSDNNSSPARPSTSASTNLEIVGGEGPGNSRSGAARRTGHDSNSLGHHGVTLTTPPDARHVAVSPAGLGLARSSSSSAEAVPDRESRPRSHPDSPRR